FEKSIEKNKKFEEVKNFFDNFYKSIRPAVRALKSAELRYQALFKSARDAILIIDKKTSNIIDANIMAEKLFGKTRAEIINQNAATFSYSEEFEKIRGYLLDIIDLKNAPLLELKIIKSNRIEIPVEINANEIRMGGQDLILIVMRNITERKIAEKKITDAYDRADFYKDLFAHDMNYILNNINATTEVLSQYLKDTKIEANKYDLLRQIKEQSLKGLNLILYVQKVLGIEGLDIAIEKMEINKILKEAMTFLSNNFFERLLEVNLETITNTSELYVMANMLLLNVFESILLNAAQHNDKPLVSIKIKVSRIKKDNKSYFKIEFLDNGKGISDKLKGTIFQKGRKLDEGFIGMGLGLYIVKKILSNHNGQIWIENRIKDDYTKGSNFIVLLPEASN
ncbi:MAG TPA: PAS domain-containing sensor histidine kinase, partial [Candidatus Lokiarchaeia archaeon]